MFLFTIHALWPPEKCESLQGGRQVISPRSSVLRMVLPPGFKVVLSVLSLLPGPSRYLFEVFRRMLSYELRRHTQIEGFRSTIKTISNPNVESFVSAIQHL